LRTKNPIALALILTLLLTGCTQKAVQTGTGAAQAPTAAALDASATELKDLAMETQNGVTQVTLSFRGEDGADTDTVPEASLLTLTEPGRVILTLPGVEKWDYRVYEDELEGSVVTGVFHHNALGGQPGELYLHTECPVQVQMKQEGGRLILSITPGELSADKAWFVLVDGYDLYPGNSSRAELDKMGLYPCLCGDASALVLLSESFDSLQAAQEAVEAWQETLEKALPGRTPTIVTLEPGQLPLHDAQTQVQSLAEQVLGENDDGEITGKTLQADGRFLSWMPQGGYLFVKTLQDGQYSYDQLWQYNGSAAQLLPGVEFSQITQAALSADGRYLAVMEQDGGLHRTAEIFDLQSGGHFLLADEGMGADTPAFAWEKTSNVLYAISGEGEDLFYQTLDLTGDAPAVTKFCQEKAHESPLLQTEKGWICLRYEDGISSAYLVEAGGFTRLGEGNRFLLSPNGQSLAISGEDGDGVGWLYLLDIQSGTRTWVEQDCAIMDMAWDADSQALYYAVYDGDNEQYPLWVRAYACATGTTDAQAHLTMGDMQPDIQPGGFLLVDIYRSASQEIGMTYQIQIP